MCMSENRTTKIRMSKGTGVNNSLLILLDTNEICSLKYVKQLIVSQSMDAFNATLKAIVTSIKELNETLAAETGIYISRDAEYLIYVANIFSEGKFIRYII